MAYSIRLLWKLEPYYGEEWILILFGQRKTSQFSLLILRSSKCLTIQPPTAQDNCNLPALKIPTNEMVFFFTHDRIQHAAYRLLSQDLAIVRFEIMTDLILARKLISRFLNIWNRILVIWVPLSFNFWYEGVEACWPLQGSHPSEFRNRPSFSGRPSIFGRFEYQSCVTFNG